VHAAFFLSFPVRTCVEPVCCERELFCLNSFPYLPWLAGFLSFFLSFWGHGTGVHRKRILQHRKRICRPTSPYVFVGFLGRVMTDRQPPARGGARPGPPRACAVASAGGAARPTSTNLRAGRRPLAGAPSPQHGLHHSYLSGRRLRAAVALAGCDRSRARELHRVKRSLCSRLVAKSLWKNYQKLLMITYVHVRI